MRGVPRYELTKKKYLLDEEQAELLRILDKYKDECFRDTTIIWLALHCGGRATEILNVTTEDLDMHGQSVFIHGLKGSDNRDIPLPPWLFKRLVKLAPAEGRIFPFTYNRFLQIWQLFRPVKKKLHALRHTFAINLYRKTKDIRLLQVALGHRSWSNALIYAQYQYKNDELRRAILG